jgi:HlyD family secretion protein
VVLFFAVFVGWAALAPLESATICSGMIVADTARPTDGVAVAARVRAEDIGDVRIGITAKIDLSGNKPRRLPMLTGVVTSISPRALEDPRTGQSYFLARLSLDRASFADFPDRMLTGMPVRVEIPTGARTALEYLLEPISAVMHNGMREK